MTLPGGTTLEGGSTVAGYTYDEYGNLESNATQGFLNETTYMGSVTDKSTGLQYMSARYYDAENGRFLTQDTYTGNPYDPWTQHLYAYCGNNPVSMVDPTGHWPFNIGEIIDNAKKILNRMLNSLLMIPFKPKVTSDFGTEEEKDRAKAYSTGYKKTKWNKSDVIVGI
jgi:RHS repeat-associated protein